MNRKQLIRNRRLAHQKQGGLCIWCGIEMFLPGDLLFKAYPKRRSTAENIIPRKHKRGEARHNIAAACANCNTKRKDYTLEEWLSLLPFRLKQMGNTAHLAVCLNWLESYANARASATPPSGADGNSQATVPPLTEHTPAP